LRSADRWRSSSPAASWPSPAPELLPFPLVSASRSKAGVDVMITVFSDFSKFSAKKIAFYLKNNVMITVLSNFSNFLVQKIAFFLKNNSCMRSSWSRMHEGLCIFRNVPCDIAN
jgi:hypothetical protein